MLHHLCAYLELDCKHGKRVTVLVLFCHRKPRLVLAHHFFASPDEANPLLHIQTLLVHTLDNYCPSKVLLCHCIPGILPHKRPQKLSSALKGYMLTVCTKEDDLPIQADNSKCLAQSRTAPGLKILQL